MTTKIDRSPPTGAPWELSASDWNGLVDSVEAGDAAEAAARAAADAAIIASGAMPANVGIAPVIATGTTEIATVADRAGREVWLEDFGEAGAGDWTAIFNAALQFLFDNGGGTLRAGRRIYRCDGKIVLPTDGAAYRPYCGIIKIAGSGALPNHGNMTWPTSGHGTVFDLRYSGDAYCRFWAVGMGGLEITGCTFVDLGSTPSTTPFMMLNGPAAWIHHNAFWVPAHAADLCYVDAIVLGGTDITFNGLPTDAFQGYGGAIENNQFSSIRRAVWMRTFCNGQVVRANWIGHKCGTNDVVNAPAPFEVIGSTSNSSCGNIISQNLIEGGSYRYLCFFNSYTNNNSFISNGIFDITAVTLAAVRVAAGSKYHTVIPGQGSGSADVYMSEEDGEGMSETLLLTAAQDQDSRIKKLVSGNIDIEAGGSFTIWPAGVASKLEVTAIGSDTAPQYLIMAARAGGASNQMAAFRQSAAGAAGEYIEWDIGGTVRSRIIGSTLLQLITADGQVVSIGNATNPYTILVDTNKLAFFAGTPQAKPTVTGSKGGNAALTDLIDKLTAFGLINNGTT